jgi:hypothetical protein
MQVPEPQAPSSTTMRCQVDNTVKKPNQTTLPLEGPSSRLSLRSRAGPAKGDLACRLARLASSFVWGNLSASFPNCFPNCFLCPLVLHGSLSDL